MKNLIQATLEKIEQQHIAPEPKWKYLLKKYLLWALCVMVLILTAIFLSAAFDNLNSLDWDLYRFMHQNRAIYMLSILPYFWLVLMGIFLSMAFIEIRKTESGYRYSWAKILLITIGSITIFSLGISFFSFGARLNSKLKEKAPFYSRHMMITKEAQWMQPKKGFLAGTIRSVSENKLELDDLSGKSWNVSLDERTLVRPAVDISQNEMIKIIGEKKDEANFKAQEIRPWGGINMKRGQAAGMMNGGFNRGGMRQGN